MQITKSLYDTIETLVPSTKSLSNCYSFEEMAVLSISMPVEFYGNSGHTDGDDHVRLTKSRPPILLSILTIIVVR